MRDNFNMLPIVQDNMNYMAGGITNISSNGYYGFQPAPLQEKQQETFPLEAPNSPSCEMDVQFESLPPQSQCVNRKRCWEFSNDFREFKKRRQNEPILFTYQPPTTEPPNRDVKLRKPTHNIPDMPRCIMAKIHVLSMKKIKDIIQKDDLFEELLRETHGCSIYHWDTCDL